MGERKMDAGRLQFTAEDFNVLIRVSRIRGMEVYKQQIAAQLYHQAGGKSNGRNDESRRGSRKG